MHLAQGLHVDEVAVVAEQVAGAVGDRPDDRHAPAPGRERQDPVVLDQDQRPLGERAGGARLVGGERLEERLVRDRDVRLVEQPEAELHAEHALDVRVERRVADPAVREGGLERRAEDDRPRKLGVDARHEREPGGLGEVVGQLVGGGDHLDADVVRRHDAVEAPLVAEDAREQRGRGVAGHAVHVAVRRHHARDAGPPDRRLEREQLLVAQLPLADVRRRLVHAALGQPVADHVLGGRDDALGQVGSLERLDVGAAEDRGEVRILAVGLLDPAPAGIAADVEDRGERVPGAGQQHPPPDRGGGRRDDVGVEARGGADRLLEAGGLPGDEAVQALLVDDRRDPQPRLLDQVALDRVGGRRPPRPGAGSSSPRAG